MDQHEFEEDLKAVLSSQEWKETSDIMRAVEAHWRIRKNLFGRQAPIEIVYASLVRLAKARVVSSRAPSPGKTEWLLRDGSRGMPVDDLPGYPPELSGNTAAPL